MSKLAPVGLLLKHESCTTEKTLSFSNNLSENHIGYICRAVSGTHCYMLNLSNSCSSPHESKYTIELVKWLETPWTAFIRNYFLPILVWVILCLEISLSRSVSTLAFQKTPLDGCLHNGSIISFVCMLFYWKKHHWWHNRKAIIGEVCKRIVLFQCDTDFFYIHRWCSQMKKARK